MGTSNKSRTDQELERYGVWVKTNPDDTSDIYSQSEIEIDPPTVSDTDDGFLREENNNELDIIDMTDEYNNDISTDISLDSSNTGLSAPDYDSRIKELEQTLKDLKGEIHLLNDAICGLQSQHMQVDNYETQGFFVEDEDDESISPIGEELDNILNSCNFVEMDAEDSTSTAMDSGFDDGVIDLTREDEFGDSLPPGDDPAMAILDDTAGMESNLDEVVSIDEIPSGDMDNISSMEVVPDPGLDSTDDTEDIISFDTEEESSADEVDFISEFNPSDSTLKSPDETSMVDVEEMTMSESFDLPDIEDISDIPVDEPARTFSQDEVKEILTYMTQLYSALPENKLEEMTNSNQYKTYSNLLEELGIHPNGSTQIE